MTPQELKSSILQMAIQGKLVEQRPEEGTAEELYQQIQAEKQKLIRAKKIKKSKPLPEITEEETPFEIPETWKWVTIPHIAVSDLGKTLDKVKNTGNMQPYLCSINVYWKGIDLSTVKESRFEDRELSKYKLQKGDLLICEGGEAGRCAVWDREDIMYYQNALHRIRFYGNINSYYFKYIMECYKGLGYLNRYSKGVTIQHLVQKSLFSIWFPLPPLAEQKRIVAKIEELLPYIDRYEKAWSELEDFNKRFPVDMQKSVLQMAIQGKLVEQRPEEGTGEELYRQIQAEKQRLIKEKKIKKSKPLPEISEEDIPFEIPESWKWVRLRSLGIFSSGKTPTMGESKYWDNGTVSWITSKDMKKKYLNCSEMLITDVAASEMKIYPENTILMVVRSGILKRLLPVAILAGDSTINQDIKALSLYIPDIAEYVYCLLKGMESYILKKYRKQVTTVDSLRFEDFQNMPVPLPPLAEQKRIVSKLEEILPLCERLK